TGAGPARDHATGRTSGTPSSSLPQRSTTVTCGFDGSPASWRSAAGGTAPERSISRSRLRSLARLAGATPKARPISLAPTGEGLSRINARTSSLEGSSEILVRDLNDRRDEIAPSPI